MRWPHQQSFRFSCRRRRMALIKAFGCHDVATGQGPQHVLGDVTEDFEPGNFDEPSGHLLQFAIENGKL